MHLSSNMYRLDGAASSSHCLVVAPPVRTIAYSTNGSQAVCVHWCIYIYPYTKYKYHMGLTPHSVTFFHKLLLGREAPVRTLNSVDFSYFL